MSAPDSSLAAGGAAGWVVALDLEGVLVSSAVSCFARPGLHAFFEALRDLEMHVVLFTSVPEARVRSVLRLLADEHTVPGWAAGLACVRWAGPHKDLRFVLDAVPGAVLARVLLVDDTPEVVRPGQELHWIGISPYTPPFDPNDGELARAIAAIRARCGAHPRPAADASGH